MVGVPGFWARFLTRFLARFLTRVFGQVFWTRKYSVQYYRDGNIQFYSTTETEKKQRKTVYESTWFITPFNVLSLLSRACPVFRHRGFVVNMSVPCVLCASYCSRLSVLFVWMKLIRLGVNVFDAVVQLVIRFVHWVVASRLFRTHNAAAPHHGMVWMVFGT